MIRRLPILSLILAATPAAAQVIPDFPAAPVLTPAQSARVDSLAERALSAFEALPAAKRPGAAGRLINDLVMVRRCSLADPLLRAHPVAASSVALTAHPEMADSDRACVDRLIAVYAETLVPGTTERDPWRLYTAGALWKRMGEHDKASAAFEQAELGLAEGSDEDGGWSCHGGNCLNRLWSTRLWALRLTRGTHHHRTELRWAATLALSQAAARDARRPGPFVGHALFEELLRLAVDAGDDSLAQLLAEQYGEGSQAAYAGERMRLLLEQGKVAEALELWPTAGAAFQAPITPDLFRANLPLFHRWREQLGTRHWRGPGELLSLLAAVWVERGEPERAREALATARAHHASVKGHDWEPQHVRRLLAVEAMLEGGRDPIGWLGRQNLPARGPSLQRDHSFRELAALLAATGRQSETRRALAMIRDPRTRRSTLVDLPCRAAHGGDAAAAFAVSLARGHLRAGSREEEKESGFANDSYRTFACLIRAGRGEAAIAYARAVDDPDVRLTLLAGLPLDGNPETAFRRRGASLALALVEARGLWADRLVPYIAADFERVGDFAQVDRIIARVPGAEARMEVYDRVLRSYAPSPYY